MPTSCLCTCIICFDASVFFLANRWGHKYFIVFDWCMKTEYQGRGTPHWHICAWVVSFGMMQSLAGRIGTAVVSAFVKFLGILFGAEIDVQIGNGRLNYISGYVAKDHDAVDVGLGEYVQKNANTSWLTAYRLLSKSSPCLPEVAIRMASPFLKLSITGLISKHVSVCLYV